MTQGPMEAELAQFSVNAAADAMFTISPDGRMLNANRAACERLEYSQEELIGMQVADIDPLYPQEMWPAHFDELRRNGKMSLETQHRSKSGRIYDVAVSVAYFEFNGNEYCCSSARDITGQKETENLLRVQRLVLSRIASTIGDLNETLTELCRLVEELVPHAMATIMLVDKSDGALRFAAGPALTPTICKAFGPMIPSEDAGSCGSAAYLRRPVIVEDTRVSPHWKTMQSIVKEFNLLACWSLPIMDEQNNVLGTFAISHSRAATPSQFQKNLLETASNLASIAICRKRSEESLQFAHNELADVGRLSTMGEMASNISHELNQPLAALVNEAFVLKTLSQRDPLKLDLIRQHAESLHGQAMRAAEIVSSMRNLAKKVSPTRKCVGIDEILRRSLVLVEPEIRHSGTVLESNFQAVDKSVDVDLGQIQQVLVNLIRNAIEAMRQIPSGQRVLSLSTDLNDSGKVVIRVADTGPGIAAENPETVFQAFHTTKADGMGMGLAISRSIAIAHGGTLTVTEANTQGAEFSLLIPLATEKQEQAVR